MLHENYGPWQRRSLSILSNSNSGTLRLLEKLGSWQRWQSRLQLQSAMDGMPLRWYLAVLCLTLSLSLFLRAEGQAGTCLDRTAGVTLVSPNGRMVLTSYGDHGVLSGAMNGQIVSNSFALNLSTSVITERARASQSNKCAVPKLESPFATVDPFGRPYAPIIANYTRDLFDCENTVSEYTRSGVKIHRLIQNMTLVTNRDFWIATAYEFSESALVEQPSTNTTFTRGVPYEYHWRYAKKR